MGGESVISVEILKRRSLWGYNGDDWVLFLKVTVSSPKTVPKIRDKSCLRLGFLLDLFVFLFVFLRIFERGECYFRDGLFPPAIQTYESNVAYVLRFMIDTKV